MNNFGFESSSTKVKFSIETLLDEVKASISENSQFEKQDKSNLGAFFLDLLDDHDFRLGLKIIIF